MPALGIVGAMIYYALFLYQHAINVPLQDDILDILQFLNNVVTSTDFNSVFWSFYDNHNEHRTLASRLVYYTAYSVEGEANFKTLTFLANLAPLLLLLTLYFAVRQHSRALWVLLPAALILFQPRTYELAFFSMAAFGYMYVYVYGFASLLCLNNLNVKRFIAAVLFAVLGTYSLASGQLIWLIGFAGLLHQRFILRKCSSAYLICWLASAALVLVVWRIGYETPHSMELVLSNFMASPLYYVAFFLTLAGSVFSDTNVALCAGAGAVMLCLVAYSGVRSFTREDIGLDLCLVYVTLSIVAIALGRAGFFTLNYALESRLTFPSVLLLATIVVAYLSRIPQGMQKLKIPFIVFLLAFAYWVYSFQIYPATLQGEQIKRVEFYNAGDYWVIGYSVEDASLIVKQSVSLDIYNPPERPLATPNVAPFVRPKPKPRLIRDLEQRE